MIYEGDRNATETGWLDFQHNIPNVYSPTPLDKCNNLPDGENLRTTVNFPVSYNTPVTVTCNVGYSPEGEHVITCVKGEEFQGRLPSCKCKSAVDSDI